MGSLEPAERPLVGEKLNEVTGSIQALVSARRVQLEIEDEARRLTEDRIDVTLASHSFPQGSRHLLQQTIDEIVDIFNGLGYVVADGPEAELGWYNFDALNTPPTHPARLESDTLYLDYGVSSDEVLLRTQTSPVQVRWMETHEPPVYVVVPGKVYRQETTDATHLPGVSPDRRAGRRRVDPILRSQGDAGPLLQGVLRPEDVSEAPARFLPVHRAVSRPLGFLFRL